MHDPIVIVSAARTPIGGLLGDFASLPAAQLADALVQHFQRGTSVVLGTGPHLIFENVSAQPAVTAGDWLSVPVVVSWFCTDP